MSGGQDQADEHERRRFQRVNLTLGARYLLASGIECSGFVENVSACGCFIAIGGANRAPDPGERLIIYIEKLGRFEGTAVRPRHDGFAVDFAIPAHKQERLARSLERVAAGDAAAIEQGRRHARVTGDDTPAVLRLANGTESACKIIDMSLNGASVETHLRPTIGVFVELGRMQARVVRHHEKGIAVEFAEISATPNAVRQHFSVSAEEA